MPAHTLHRLLPVAFCAVAATAAAQATAPTATRLDPQDTHVAGPAVAYTSAFKHYQRLGDDKATAWREANDTTARIGGWRVYARQAQQPDPPTQATQHQPAAPAAPQPSAMPMPQGHGGHKLP